MMVMKANSETCTSNTIGNYSSNDVIKRRHQIAFPTQLVVAPQDPQILLNTTFFTLEPSSTYSKIVTSPIGMFHRNVSIYHSTPPASSTSYHFKQKSPKKRHKVISSSDSFQSL